MKPITSNTLAAAKQAYGHEPLTVVKVEWTTGTKWYSGRDLVIGPNRSPAKVLTAGTISSSKKQDSVGMIAMFSITLDDADLTLKAKIDTSNVEYTQVTVYQWFGTLSDPADLMQVFKGSIISPVQWSEETRILSLQVETRIKDQEIGLSADIGSIQYLNPDAVDVPWPLSFGNVVHSVALKLITAPSGRLKYPFRGPRTPLVQPPTSDPYRDDTHFTLQDGDGAYFPQGTLIQVQIDGVIFGGMFPGTTLAPSDVFTVGENNLPKYENIQFTTRGSNIPYDLYQDPDPDVLLPYVAWIENTTSIVNNYCLVKMTSGNTAYVRIVRQEGNKVWFDTNVTATTDELPSPPEPTPSGDFATDGQSFYGLPVSPLVTPSGQTDPSGDPSIEGAGVSFHFFGVGDTILQVAKNGCVGWAVTENSTASDRIQKVEVLSSILWRFQPESEVTLWQPTHKDVYVANLIPAATVLAVYANRRTPDGVTQLRPIPASYYTVALSDTIVVNNKTGPVTSHPTTLTFNTPLRDYGDQGWADQIYVVMRSSVGPNASDVIKWLIDTYSSVPSDAASFATVRTQVTNYPVAFTRHRKENVAALVEEISFKARIGLVEDNGSFQVKYLGTAPTHDIVVGEGGTKLMSLVLEFSRTEDVYTRIEGKVRLSYFPAKRFEKIMVYAANVAKYGLHRREIDFDIYNIQSLAQKSLDFWGGRFTNSWRLATITMPMDGIQLQIFDTVRVQFTDTTLLNAAYVDGVVEKVEFTPGNDEVKVDLWLPMVSGTTTVSPKAYQDDSGDTMPADPTLKYDVSPFDVQHPNGESKRKVITQADGGSSPAIIVALSEAGSVTDSDTSASSANEGTTPVSVKIDVYENGYGAPATKKGVLATNVDSTVTPVNGQRVMSFVKGAYTYVTATNDGATSPAKIKSQLSLTKYQVDIFAAGYSNPSTSGGVVADVIDPNTFDFAIGDRVTVFALSGKYYIIPAKQFVTATMPLVWGGKITVNNGDGTYKASMVIGGVVQASYTNITCYEANLSPYLAIGLTYLVHTQPNNDMVIYNTLDRP